MTLGNFGSLFGLDGLLLLGCCGSVVILGAVIGGVVFFVVRSKGKGSGPGKPPG